MGLQYIPGDKDAADHGKIVQSKVKQMLSSSPLADGPRPAIFPPQPLQDSEQGRTRELNRPTTAQMFEELEDLMYAARIGSLLDIRQQAVHSDLKNLIKLQDDSGNTAIHMAAANGHTGMGYFLLQNVYFI